MSKVIMFSRTFPAYHPKAGEPTYFVDKIIESFTMLALDEFMSEEQLMLFDYSLTKNEVWPKHHTIRAGKRFKVGDKFSPHVWSGKPYRSKQIIISPDIEVVKTWDFEIKHGSFYINGKEYDGETEGQHELLELLAKNDGLEKHDFIDWFDFNKPFSGQIICWNPNINY